MSRVDGSSSSSGSASSLERSSTVVNHAHTQQLDHCTAAQLQSVNSSHSTAPYTPAAALLPCQCKHNEIACAGFTTRQAACEKYVATTRQARSLGSRTPNLFETSDHLDSAHSSTRAGRCVKFVAVMPNAAVRPDPRLAEATMDALPMLMSVYKKNVCFIVLFLSQANRCQGK